MNKVFLKDYKAPDFEIYKIDLVFDFAKSSNPVVKSTLFINKKNKEAESLVLFGSDTFVTKSIMLDKKELTKDDFVIENNMLKIASVKQDSFELNIEVDLDVENNKSCLGLYFSGENIITQCEPEGFRKITWYLDRPDNLALFNVEIIVPENKYNTALSNGNLQSYSRENGLAIYKYSDIHKKPSYLFALVVGNFDVLQDTYKTFKGKEVELSIFLNGNIQDAEFAMESLKNAMKFDEEHFGLEYDLDIYNIVSVKDFNAGAMENKSLNIFNHSYIIFNQNLATDSDKINVEAVVGHEYFHNYTGNRVTCENWFNLCLKEGLTVFREQLFSENMQGFAPMRFDEVSLIKKAQFKEDRSPFSHAPRPNEYIEIDNFYTITVYEKGAEIFRMIATMVGKDNFVQIVKKYLQNNDGKSASVEKFLDVVKEYSNFDVEHFKWWFTKKGLLNLHITKEEYNKEEKTLTLGFKEQVEAGGREMDYTFLFPLEIVVYGVATGQVLFKDILIFANKDKEIKIPNVAEECVVSVNPNFVAPLELYHFTSDEYLQNLIKLEQSNINIVFLIKNYLQQFVYDIVTTKTRKTEEVINILDNLIERFKDDGAVLAEILTMPSFDDVVHMFVSDLPIKQIIKTITNLEKEIAKHFLGKFYEIFESLKEDELVFDQKNLAIRKLKGVLLKYLVKTGAEELEDAVLGMYHSLNMTNRLNSLKAVSSMSGDFRDNLFEDFASKFKNAPLVVDKLFMIEAMAKQETALERIKKIMESDLFSLENPNNVRSLLGVFGRYNPLYFHSKDSYDFYCSVIKKIDKNNPKLASSLVLAFSFWAKYPKELKEAVQKNLQELKNSGVSKNLLEMLINLGI